MATPTNKQLREFILEYFDEDELYTFCFDYFRDVRHQFGSGMSLNDKVMELIDYCRRSGVRANFLEALKLEREQQFNKAFNQPQTEGTTAPPIYESLPRNPRKIFVSHSSEDGKLAQQIATDLQSHGYDIFITPTSIRAGEKWVDAIMRGLDECGIFLVLLTPYAIQSGWVRQEANTAIALYNGNKARLLFLHIEECEPPTLWQQWQYLSFRNKDYKENFANLLRELKEESPMPPEVALPEAQPDLPSEASSLSGAEMAQQVRQAQVASLYQQLLQAQEEAAWVDMVMLAAKIDLLAPDYLDVADLNAAAVAHLQQPQHQPEAVVDVPQIAQLLETSNLTGKKRLVGEEALLKILGQYKDESGYHLYPDIAPDDQTKIRKRLELLPENEEVMAFIVATMWGGVQAGLAFTTDRIVWRNDRFMSTLSDYSLHGQIPYEAFPESEFYESESSEIYLGEGMGFNHSGWCDLTTEQILGLLNDIKAFVAGKS